MWVEGTAGGFVNIGEDIVQAVEILEKHPEGLLEGSCHSPQMDSHRIDRWYCIGGVSSGSTKTDIAALAVMEWKYWPSLEALQLHGHD